MEEILQEAKQMQAVIERYDCDYVQLYRSKIDTPPKIAGIYFLFDGNEIVYVGQSVNIYARLTAHERTKEFDSFAYIECPPECRDYLEPYFIVKFDPRLNGNVPHNPLYKSAATLKALFGMTKHEIKKLFRKYSIKPAVVEVNMYNAPQAIEALMLERQSE